MLTIEGVANGVHGGIGERKEYAAIPVELIITVIMTLIEQCPSEGFAQRVKGAGIVARAAFRARSNRMFREIANLPAVQAREATEALMDMQKDLTEENLTALHLEAYAAMHPETPTDEPDAL